MKTTEIELLKKLRNALIASARHNAELSAVLGEHLDQESVVIVLRYCKTMEDRLRHAAEVVQMLVELQEGEPKT